MADGLYFYWLAWLAWVIVTFLWEKGKLRTLLAILFLIVIFLVPFHVLLMGFKVNAALLAIFLVCLKRLSAYKFSDVLLLMAAAFMGMMLYVTVRFFALFDPIWLKIDPRLFFSIIMTVVIWFLPKIEQESIILAVFVICLGDILFQLVTVKYTGSFEVGSPEVLDILALSIGFQWLSQEAKVLFVRLKFVIESKKKSVSRV